VRSYDLFGVRRGSVLELRIANADASRVRCGSFDLPRLRRDVRDVWPRAVRLVRRLPLSALRVREGVSPRTRLSSCDVKEDPMRRVAILFVSAIAASFALSAAADDPAMKPGATRTFWFEYQVKIPAQPGAKRLEAWVPLPLEDSHQSVKDLATEVKSGSAGPVSKGEITKDEVYGNRMIHVAIDDPKEETTVRWTAVITRKADEGMGKEPIVARFKEADHLVPITGRALDLAKELKADATSDPVQARAKRVYDNVLSTMMYDKEAPGWGKGDFERACDVGKGNCTDFHAKFTGIARAGGIPVRFTMGIPLSTDAKGKAGGYHCWAHYNDGGRWFPVDISEAQKIVSKDPAKAAWFFGHIDADRVALTVGRDLDLVPKQKGPPLLFFAYPYVEVDGKSVDVPKENRSFSFENR
jgi:transglutaminase-like putative cysteine protease